MRILLTCIAATLLSFSAIADVGGPALNYLDLEKMARAAIKDEVSVLNTVIKDYLSEQENVDLKGYKKRDLQIFKAFNKPDGIDPEILFDSCLLTETTISAISSRRMSRDNLKVTSNIYNVDSLKKSINGKFFRIAERACLNSKQRLIVRLAAATSGGAPLNLTDEAIQNVATVAFYPAVFSKPTVGKFVMKALPILVQTVFILTAASPAVAVAVGTTWISLTRITGSSLAIKGMIPGSNEIFKQCYISATDLKEGIRIDLSEDESDMAF